MKIICAWCSRVIKESEMEESDPPSHGMCPICFEKAMMNADEDRINHDAEHGGRD